MKWKWKEKRKKLTSYSVEIFMTANEGEWRKKWKKNNTVLIVKERPTHGWPEQHARADTCPKSVQSKKINEKRIRAHASLYMLYVHTWKNVFEKRSSSSPPFGIAVREKAYRYQRAHQWVENFFDASTD